MGQTRRDAPSDDIADWIPALRAFAWTLCRKQQEVDDLVQETLVKGIAAYDRYQRGTNMRAWLFTIMRNTFYSASVKTTRERPAAADCASTSVIVPPTQEWSVRGKEVWAAVGRLPQHYREVLILVGMLGESYESASDICRVPIGTVKSRLNRARALLLCELGEESAGSSAPSERHPRDQLTAAWQR